MNLQKMQTRCAAVLDPGETLTAATKVTPRGAAHEIITGAAGGVAAAGVSPALGGAGMIVGQKAGSGPSDQGRAEREAAGVDVGNASQVLLGVTDRRVVMIKLSALGRAKEILAAVDRTAITTAEMGETKLFGQSMAEIVLTLNGGAEVGFGVAKVHRRDGDAVLVALQE